MNNCPVCGKTDFSLYLEVPDYFLTRETFSIFRCESCGFKFINPRPGEEEIGRYYQSENYISHDASGKSLLKWVYKAARTISVRTKFKIVRKHSGPGKILDVGCGTGEFLRHCRMNGYEISGGEPNDKAGTFAREVNGIPVNRSLNDLIRDRMVFDCITLWHVLEHLHDLNETLERIKRMLTPDGVVIVAVPNSNSWDAQKYGRAWAAYDVPRHLYHFTVETMQALAANHGFEIPDILPQKLDAYYVSMLSEKYLTGKNSYFKSMAMGFWSNFQAGRDRRGHSSQIFVLKTKKA